MWLTLDFDQDGKVFGFAFVPGLEGFQKLEAVAGWRNLHIDVLTVLWGCLVQRCAVFEMRGEFSDVWWGESKLSAVLCWYRVFGRVVLQRSGKSESCHKLGRCDERVRLRVPIVSANEVPVVRRYHRVWCSLGKSHQRFSRAQYFRLMNHQPSRLPCDSTGQRKGHLSCSGLLHPRLRSLAKYSRVLRWLESFHFLL